MWPIAEMDSFPQSGSWQVNPPPRGSALGRERKSEDPATLCRSRSTPQCPHGGRSRQHAEVAATVDPRRWHEGGKGVEQLERDQTPRATAAGTRFRRVVHLVLAVESRATGP